MSFSSPSFGVTVKTLVIFSFFFVDPQKFRSSGYSQYAEKDMPSFTQDDIIAQIIERHEQFLGSMQSHLGKLQVSIFSNLSLSMPPHLFIYFMLGSWLFLLLFGW